MRVFATWTRISKTLFLYARFRTTRFRPAVESLDTGAGPFSRPKSLLNSAIGRMQVEVESTIRCPGPSASIGSSWKRSANVPMTARSPLPTGAFGTWRSLTRIPLVEWLSYRTHSPFSCFK